MQQRWEEFQKELKFIKDKEFPFVELAILFQQWATYITNGGVRPQRPH